jgi:hypothetical protein
MPKNNFENGEGDSVEKMIEREAADLELAIEMNREAYADMDPKTVPEDFIQKLYARADEALETLGVIVENLQGEALTTLGTKASLEDPATIAVREGINAIINISRKAKEWLH